MSSNDESVVIDFDKKIENNPEKLKSYKISIGKYYTGPFASPKGNPDFGLFPIIAKYIFLILALYFVINKNYKYTIYILLCYMIGCILNGYRFSYISVISIEGEDHQFIESVTRDNIIGASLSFIAIIYILFKKYKK